MIYNIQTRIQHLLNDSLNLINYTFPSDTSDIDAAEQNKLRIINTNLKTVGYLVSEFEMSDLITDAEFTEIWHSNG